jgi:hypothetical protein
MAVFHLVNHLAEWLAEGAECDDGLEGMNSFAGAEGAGTSGWNWGCALGAGWSGCEGGEGFGAGGAEVGVGVFFHCLAADAEGGIDEIGEIFGEAEEHKASLTYAERYGEIMRNSSIESSLTFRQVVFIM